MSISNSEHSSVQFDGLILLESIVVDDADSPPECTIFPRYCSEDELVTRWITAVDDAFVSLEDHR